MKFLCPQTLETSLLLPPRSSATSWNKATWRRNEKVKQHVVALDEWASLHKENIMVSLVQKLFYAAYVTFPFWSVVVSMFLQTTASSAPSGRRDGASWTTPFSTTLGARKVCLRRAETSHTLKAESDNSLLRELLLHRQTAKGLLLYKRLHRTAGAQHQKRLQEKQLLRALCARATAFPGLCLHHNQPAHIHQNKSVSLLI